MVHFLLRCAVEPEPVKLKMSSLASSSFTVHRESMYYWFLARTTARPQLAGRGLRALYATMGSLDAEVGGQPAMVSHKKKEFMFCTPTCLDNV